ncbi:MAG: hypothetical protein ACD_10C00091G0002 [uncultured bacterium]|nr:MAG: hypothetical protein ACD_10C00091G0002 [uncultured bacterium]
MGEFAFDVPSLSCQAPLYCWLPVDVLVPGMTLARRVIGQSEGRVTLALAAGTELTTGTIGQLTIKAVECVAVLNEHPPEVGDYLALQQDYEARLRAIFDCAEGVNEDCRGLFDALIMAGPM